MEEKKVKKCYCHNCGEYLGDNIRYEERWCGSAECEREARDAHRQRYEEELDELNERYRNGW